MKLLPFKPVRDGVNLESPGNYDYGPSAVNGRVFWTCGLNTDTIVSCRMDGSKPSPPYQISPNLAADPDVLKIGSRYLVAHTVGAPDGTRNGVGYYWANGNGVPITKTRMLIPQSKTVGTYGNGQPALFTFGDQFFVMWRRDGIAPGELVFSQIHITGDTVRVVAPDLTAVGTVSKCWAPEAIANNEHVGASVDAFQWGNYVGIFRCGGVWVGWSIHPFKDRMLYPAVDSLRIPFKVVDGACVELDRDNRPVLENGNFVFWVAEKKVEGSQDWRLVRGTIPAPKVGG